MAKLVTCPECGGLVKAGRAACSHCGFAPSRSRAVALGLTAAVGFGALVAAACPACAAYGACLQPDGNFCGAGQTTDAGPDAGKPDGGDAG
jgi:hypothetical protein